MTMRIKTTKSCGKPDFSKWNLPELGGINEIIEKG